MTNHDKKILTKTLVKFAEAIIALGVVFIIVKLLTIK